MKRTAVAAILALSALAQQPPAKLAFEAASIKPDNPELSSGGHARSVNANGGINLSLKNLIMSAYHLRTDSQIAGGPKWLDTAGWDITYKYPAGSTQAQYPAMMQNLLAERFQLVVHRETRTLPVYSLTVAKSGPKLKEAADDRQSMAAGPRMLRYTAATMEDLANQLSSYLSAPVTDNTGLKGRYDMKINFAPVNPGDNPSGPTDDSPSLFTALQEQLGLKLDSAKGPVEVLVIDKAEMPSAN